MDEPRGRILLVEDEPLVARVYSRALEAAGYKVELAADGAEGLERVLAGSYEVVVSDLRMPRLDGLDLLRGVSRLRPDVAFILMTAELDAQAYVTARDLGSVRYLLKPVSMEQLARAVENAVMLRAARMRSGEREVLSVRRTGHAPPVVRRRRT